MLKINNSYLFKTLNYNNSYLYVTIKRKCTFLYNNRKIPYFAVE